MAENSIQKKKIAFVINPNAGSVSRRSALAEMIRSGMPENIDAVIIVWEKAGELLKIKEQILQSNFDTVVAVGGDGTVNAVAQLLVDTDISLGIIPCGSGNGLARHFKIPLSVKKAITLINKGNVIKIDSCYINDKAFFCTAGIGFDAHIGQIFAESKTRGFRTYFKLSLMNFLHYKAANYRLTIAGREVQRKAFLISFANTSQYGNNAYIAPKANAGDGLIDVCILKPFRFWNAIGIAMRLFSKKIDNSSFFESYQVAGIKLERDMSGPVHYDGETWLQDKEIIVRMKPSSLKIVVPV